MQKTKFSIIIPTRQRLDTLRSTLSSCIAQEYDDFDVHVLVNYCPETSKYLDTIADTRIHSHPSHNDLSMSDNWERGFNLGIPSDNYVLFLGDDDGLLPDALSTASNIIESNKDIILSWKKAEYCWPEMLVPEYRDFAYLPLSSTIKRIDTKRFLKKSHEISVGYDQGPSVYSSFVKMAVLEKLRGEAGGKFFRSSSPDVYSAYILSTVVEEILRCEFSLSVNGASKHSNGISAMNSLDTVSYQHFLKSSSLHPKLVLVPSVFIAEADAILSARDTYPNLFRKYDYSIDHLVDMLSKEAISLSDGLRFKKLSQGITDICKKNGIAIPAIAPLGAEHKNPTLNYGYDPGRNGLAMNLALFRVSNVWQAAQFMASLDPLKSKHWHIEKEPSEVRSLFPRAVRKIKSKFLGGARR